MNKGKFIKIGHVTITNNNANEYKPENLVEISWPAFGDRDIEFAEQFSKDLIQAIKKAKKLRK